MTKRIVAILLTAAIAAATITACGKTAESPETTAVTVEETETKTETETVQETTVEETKYSSSYSKDSYSSSTEKVTCSMCNGTGLVKYYYGSSALEAAMDGHDDYEYGNFRSWSHESGNRYCNGIYGFHSSGCHHSERSRSAAWKRQFPGDRHHRCNDADHKA